MNLSEFHNLVSVSLNRGSTLDTKIPAMVGLAAQWLERNYTFKYMERFKLIQVVAGDRTIVLPLNVVIKGMKFLRFIGSDGGYSYIKKIEPEDAVGVGQQLDSNNIPSSYWIVGTTTLVFSGVPTQELNGEAMWYEYTDWPKEPASTNFLLQTGSDVLLAQTLLNMSAFVTRDIRMVQGYKAMRDEGVNTLTRAADETAYAGESLAMQYRPA